MQLDLWKISARCFFTVSYAPIRYSTKQRVVYDKGILFVPLSAAAAACLNALLFLP